MWILFWTSLLYVHTHESKLISGRKRMHLISSLILFLSFRVSFFKGIYLRI